MSSTLKTLSKIRSESQCYHDESFCLSHHEFYCFECLKSVYNITYAPLTYHQHDVDVLNGRVLHVDDLLHCHDVVLERICLKGKNKILIKFYQHFWTYIVWFSFSKNIQKCFSIIHFDMVNPTHIFDWDQNVLNYLLNIKRPTRQIPLELLVSFWYTYCSCNFLLWNLFHKWTWDFTFDLCLNRRKKSFTIWIINFSLSRFFLYFQNCKNMNKMLGGGEMIRARECEVQGVHVWFMIISTLCNGSCWYISCEYVTKALCQGTVNNYF